MLFNRYIHILGLITFTVLMLACTKEEPCKETYRETPEGIKTVFQEPLYDTLVLKSQLNDYDTIVSSHSIRPNTYNYNGCITHTTESSMRFHMFNSNDSIKRVITMENRGTFGIELWQSTIFPTQHNSHSRKSLIYYEDTDEWAIFPEGYIQKIDSLEVNGSYYYNNLQLGKLVRTYDSLTLSPEIGIIMYYRDGEKYELYETS